MDEKQQLFFAKDSALKLAQEVELIICNAENEPASTALAAEKIIARAQIYFDFLYVPTLG